MKLVLNSKICDKYQFSLEEILILYLVMHNPDFNATINALKDRGLLQSQDGKYSISDSAKSSLCNVMAESGNINETRLSNLAIEMQKCFPQGKPQGSVNYFRANKREIIFQLQKFFVQYGNYPDEDILSATKDYIESFRGNYRYLPIITNFILKTTKILDERGDPVIKESSQLATQLENRRQEGNKEAVINDDSWLVTSRN